MKKVHLLFCLILISSFCLFAQEGESQALAETDDVEINAEENGQEEIRPEIEDPADTTGLGFSYIEMDIRTSSLMELAAWARELGLNDGGSRETLAARLRAHYRLPTPAGAAATAQRVITIEAANTTEYFTIFAVDEEYARLRGDVIVSLRDGNSIHRIQAWEVLYNRTRNVMSAAGNVVYTKIEGDTTETFRGQSITVNLDNWSSIFMDGISEKSVTGRTAAYRFAGTIISRNDEEVTVLTRATISNAASEEVFWSITASRLWLLPGNDWAIANAVLRVGNIPVFYIPFFFHPADEIVFRPVLGYRSREGTFLQTTTYLLGRPRASAMTENSITRIFGGDDGSDRRREGIFLRTTGERVYDPRNIRLSVLADAYTNLGIYLGTELSLPPRGRAGETSISAGLGFSRDIHFARGSWTPFLNNDGVSTWNRGMLFFFDLPMRYRFDASGSFTINHGSLAWNFPYYSDPFVDRDFMHRLEPRDWLGTFMDWGAEEPLTTTTLSSYEWGLRGSFNPPVRHLNPFVTSFSVSNFNSNLLFHQRNSPSYTGPSSPPNPGRAFFFPDRLTMFSVSASMAGTPFTSGAAAVARETPLTGPAPGDELLPDLPIPPWESVEVQGAQAIDPFEIYTFAPPVLNQRFTFPARGGPQLVVDYRLTPTAATEMQFRSSRWREQEEINWGDVASILTSFRSDADIGFTVTHTEGGAYTGALRFSGTGSFRSYPFLNEAAEEFAGAAARAARVRAWSETFFTSSWDASASVRPFFRNPVWGATNFSYALRGLLGGTAVDTSEHDPSWDWTFGSWDGTDIANHAVTANLAANVMDNNQTFSISAVLPPRDSAISGNLTLRAWITETSVRGRVLHPFDYEERIFEPITFTETLRINPQASFQQNVVFDPELGEFTTITSSLSIPNFTSSFSALFAQPFRFNYQGSVDSGLPDGWVQLPDRALRPHELRFAYRNTFARTNLWDNRLNLSFGLNTDLIFDLQRYTNTRFNFGLESILTIPRLLDLRFSTRSENAVMFKYFQNLPFFDMPTQLYSGMEQNIFIDLLNSFRFDNDDLRRQSGFKLRALNIAMIHHLGDWNATLSVNMTPHLPQGSRTYRFNNEVSFLIQWMPITELSTRIDYQYDRLTVR